MYLNGADENVVDEVIPSKSGTASDRIGAGPQSTAAPGNQTNTGT